MTALHARPVPGGHSLVAAAVALGALTILARPGLETPRALAATADRVSQEIHGELLMGNLLEDPLPQGLDPASSGGSTAPTQPGGPSFMPLDADLDDEAADGDEEPELFEPEVEPVLDLPADAAETPDVADTASPAGTADRAEPRPPAAPAADPDAPPASEGSCGSCRVEPEPPVEGAGCPAEARRCGLGDTGR